jgi:hypothetical protein
MITTVILRKARRSERKKGETDTRRKKERKAGAIH